MEQLSLDMKDLMCKLDDAETVLYNDKEVIDPYEASLLFEEYHEIIAEIIHQLHTLRHDVDLLKRTANFDKFNKLVEKVQEPVEDERFPEEMVI